MEAMTSVSYELWGAVVVVGIVGTLLWAARRRAARYRGAPVAGLTEGREKTGAERESGAAPDGVIPAREAAAWEQSKLVVHALLQDLSEGVEALHADSSKYGNSLDHHRTAIKKTMTIASIHELERVMLSELDEMRAANNHYRQQLDRANAKLKAQQQELDRLHADAKTDFLTKVPNRRMFDSRLNEELSRAKRYGNIFSLVLIDIDHFKQVNDVHGHLTGDRVLRAVAHVLDEHRRESDFLARYGGEEFVLLLPETSADSARTLAETVRRNVERTKFRCEETTVRLTVSIGVCEVAPATDTAQSLFARVDAALYGAKERGRNRVEVALAPS
jgi:diguanylate cyclase